MGIDSKTLDAAVRKFIVDAVDDWLSYTEDAVNDIPGVGDLTDDEWDTAVEDFKRLAREKARN